MRADRIALGAVAFFAILLWVFRFDVAGTSYSGRPSVYILDRWTGTVSLCVGVLCEFRIVKMKKRTATAP